MIKEVIIDGIDTGWKVSDSGYTIDTWGRKSYGTYNRTAGYLQVTIGGKKYLMHRLVASNFLSIPTCNPDGTELVGKLQVNHKNEDPMDNRVENLEWCDNSYNNRYGTKIERSARKLAKRYKCIETGEVGQPVFFEQKYGINRQKIRDAANPNAYCSNVGGYHFVREGR